MRPLCSDLGPPPARRAEPLRPCCRYAARPFVEAGTMRPPHLPVDVVDRPCVPLGGPSWGPQPLKSSPVGAFPGPSPGHTGARGGRPVQTDAIGRHAIETAIVVDVCH